MLPTPQNNVMAVFPGGAIPDYQSQDWSLRWFRECSGKERQDTDVLSSAVYSPHLLLTRAKEIEHQICSVAVLLTLQQLSHRIAAACPPILQWRSLSWLPCWTAQQNEVSPPTFVQSTAASTYRREAVGSWEGRGKCLDTRCISQGSLE